MERSHAWVDVHLPGGKSSVSVTARSNSDDDGFKPADGWGCAQHIYQLMGKGLPYVQVGRFRRIDSGTCARTSRRSGSNGTPA
jgi:hypothetical protein